MIRWTKYVYVDKGSRFLMYLRNLLDPKTLQSSSNFKDVPMGCRNLKGLLLSAFGDQKNTAKISKARF